MDDNDRKYNFITLACVWVQRVIGSIHVEISSAWKIACIFFMKISH